MPTTSPFPNSIVTYPSWRPLVKQILGHIFETDFFFFGWFKFSGKVISALIPVSGREALFQFITPCLGTPPCLSTLEQEPMVVYSDILRQKVANPIEVKKKLPSKFKMKGAVQTEGCWFERDVTSIAYDLLGF